MWYIQEEAVVVYRTKYKDHVNYILKLPVLEFIKTVPCEDYFPGVGLIAILRWLPQGLQAELPGLLPHPPWQKFVSAYFENNKTSRNLGHQLAD